MAASRDSELEAALRALSNVDAHTQSLEDMFMITSDRALRPKHDLETALRALDAIGKRADGIDEAIGRASASATPLLAAPQEQPPMQEQPPSPRGIARPQGDALMTEARRLAHQQLDALFEEDASNLPMFLRLLSGMSREAETAERAEAVRLLMAVAADLSESMQQEQQEQQQREQQLMQQQRQQQQQQRKSDGAAATPTRSRRSSSSSSVGPLSPVEEGEDEHEWGDDDEVSGDGDDEYDEDYYEEGDVVNEEELLRWVRSLPEADDSRSEDLD